MDDIERLHGDVHRWCDAGFAVLPAKMDGSKHPTGPWRGVGRGTTPAPTPEAVIDGLRQHESTGIAVLMGAGSRQSEMVEFEGRASDLLARLEAAVAEAGITALWERLVTGCVYSTPGGGRHHILRVTDGPAVGNEKLALNDKDEVLAETRGAGGLVIAAPSFGKSHPTGKPYVWHTGGPETVPGFTVAERTALYAAFRTLDKRPRKPLTVAPVAPTESPYAVGRLFDRVSWDDILLPRGWTKLGHHVRVTPEGVEIPVTDWTRPGETLHPRSASTTPTAMLCWSSSTPLPNQDAAGEWRGMSKFTVYVFLAHDGNFTAAARAVHAGREAGLSIFQIARGVLPTVRVAGFRITRR